VGILPPQLVRSDGLAHDGRVAFDVQDVVHHLKRQSDPPAKGANSLDDNKIADYMRKNEFKTIMGDWRYGPNGEWTKSGMMQVQYHGIKEGAGLDTWRGMSYQTVLTPPEQKTGNVIYPYEKAK